MNLDSKQIEGYKFDEANHIHYLDSKPLMGVTSVLNVIGKEALIPWASGCAVDFLKEHIKKGKVITDEIYKEAKSAYKKKRDSAGNVGTMSHKLIESYIKSSTEPVFGQGDDIVKKIFENFKNWSVTNKVKFLESEKNVYSRELWIGGICDFVCEIDGKIYIGDVKTSSGIYPENFWQTSAYQYCLKEMGLYDNITGHIIVNCRKDGSFDEKRSISYNEGIEAFKACLTIYKISKKFSNQII